MTQQNRIRWVDVSKALGIFAIYLGHFGPSVGYGYQFVFTYHVPLFFFLSGCTNHYDTEINLLRFIKKKVKSLLIPYVAFALLSVIVYVLRFNPGVDQIIEQLRTIILGSVRNQFFAVSLWFLTCLFTMELLFKLLKCLPNVWIVFIVCLGLYVISLVFMNPSPIIEPRWVYNIDSSLYYIVYFCLGYVIFPYIVKLLEMTSKRQTVIVIISGTGALLYAVGLFFGVDFVLAPVERVPLIGMFIPIVRAFVIIWLNLILAKCLESVHILNKIGRETLFLCGNEYIMEICVPAVLSILGLELELSSPLAVYIYSGFLLILGLKLFIPVEKNVVHAILTFLRNGASHESYSKG